MGYEIRRERACVALAMEVDFARSRGLWSTLARDEPEAGPNEAEAEAGVVGGLVCRVENGAEGVGVEGRSGVSDMEGLRSDLRFSYDRAAALLRVEICGGGSE